jgi:hypothetical protein
MERIYNSMKNVINKIDDDIYICSKVKDLINSEEFLNEFIKEYKEIDDIFELELKDPKIINIEANCNEVTFTFIINERYELLININNHRFKHGVITLIDIDDFHNYVYSVEMF